MLIPYSELGVILQQMMDEMNDVITTRHENRTVNFKKVVKTWRKSNRLLTSRLRRVLAYKNCADKDGFGSRGNLMATTDELLDELMNKCKKPEDLIGEHGLLKHLSRKPAEQVAQNSVTELFVHPSLEERR